MDPVPPPAIGRMFSSLAGRYRAFNRWSSLGLDTRWRRCLLKEVSGAQRVLDLGTGTGDLAWGIQASSSAGTVVAGIDLSLDMLRQARHYGEGGLPLWSQGSAAGIPFKTGCFDAVVSAFVLRNLWVGGVLPESLRECARVLESGGRLVFLDLTRPGNFWLRWGHCLYNRTMVPLWGRVFFGKEWPGSYLANSIQALPSPQDLRQLFEESGFSHFEHRPLSGGVVSLFIGKK
ncbi:MAG: class I SAM-dependent methyltransferase [Elusimicrobia bacterium]|nr:class I SAM-dependent methyltransferase [Elusimicrobiota bacterium]